MRAVKDRRGRVNGRLGGANLPPVSTLMGWLWISFDSSIAGWTFYRKSFGAESIGCSVAKLPQQPSRWRARSATRFRPFAAEWIGRWSRTQKQVCSAFKELSNGVNKYQNPIKPSQQIRVERGQPNRSADDFIEIFSSGKDIGVPHVDDRNMWNPVCYFGFFLGSYLFNRLVTDGSWTLANQVSARFGPSISIRLTRRRHMRISLLHCANRVQSWIRMALIYSRAAIIQMSPSFD